MPKPRHWKTANDSGLLVLGRLLAGREPYRLVPDWDYVDHVQRTERAAEAIRALGEDAIAHPNSALVEVRGVRFSLEQIEHRGADAAVEYANAFADWRDSQSSVGSGSRSENSRTKRSGVASRAATR